MMLAYKRAGIRIIAGGVAALLGLAFGACSGGGSPTSTEAKTKFGTNDPSVVVALGDSITFGEHDMGVEHCDETKRGLVGFCPPLAQLTGKTVINEGECGDDSSGGLDRIQGVLQRWRPGVILIDYSQNDTSHGTGTLLLNLRSLIATARSNHTVPILGTLVPAVGDNQSWEPFIESANAGIRALCVELGVECADHYQAFINDPDYQISPYALLSWDGLHPNTAGYALMAKTWSWPLLRVY